MLAGEATPHRRAAATRAAQPEQVRMLCRLRDGRARLAVDVVAARRTTRLPRSDGPRVAIV